MTPDLLAAAGAALYGPRWQSDLARDLDVGDRTMRRWATGRIEIPAEVRDELAALCRRRGHDLVALAARLDA